MHTIIETPTPVFAGTRGRVLSLLCAADNRLSGGQIATATGSSRSTCHGVLRELVAAGIVRRHVHPSVMMFELEDNAVARAIDTLHVESCHRETRIAAAQILTHVLPQWASNRDELRPLLDYIR